MVPFLKCNLCNGVTILMSNRRGKWYYCILVRFLNYKQAGLLFVWIQILATLVDSEAEATAYDEISDDLTIVINHVLACDTFSSLLKLCLRTAGQTL